MLIRQSSTGFFLCSAPGDVMVCEVCVYVCVCVCLCAQSCLTCWDPVDLACQSPLYMEFSRQEYWSGLLFPTPGDLLNPGIKPESPASSALAGRFFTTVPATWETQGGMQHSQFTWAQNPFFLNISRIRVLWNTIFSNGMFICNDFKFFIKGGLWLETPKWQFSGDWRIGCVTVCFHCWRALQAC